MNEPHHWTLKQTQLALEERKISAVELLDWFFQRIQRINPQLNAFITVMEDARSLALKVDQRRSQGLSVGVLGGIPIAMKDLMDTANVRTTYGGRHYANHVPIRSATVVRRLENAGAILIGKTNLHEYAYSTSNENPHYGDARNPWDPTRISGGSSGGSAIAVTAGLSSAAIGTDTGGSIRIPAALTGHVGLKPTFGLVSKAGVFPLAPTLDHVGPMTKTVSDAAVLLDVMAGYDPDDEYSVRTSVKTYVSRSDGTPKRLGIPKSFFYEFCQPDVKLVIDDVLLHLEQRGFQLVEIDIPLMNLVPEMQGIVISSEAYAVHRELYESAPELYGEDVRSRLEASSQILGHQYVKALSHRRQFKLEMQRVFEKVDILVTPTTPLTATPIGTGTTVVASREFPIRGHLTRYTNPWNFSGLPAISIPCGTTEAGLPVGLQLVGAAFAERKLLDVAEQVERSLNWTPIAPLFR